VVPFASARESILTLFEPVLSADNGPAFLLHVESLCSNALYLNVARYWKAVENVETRGPEEVWTITARLWYSKGI
jgi:hypothetical protein